MPQPNKLLYHFEFGRVGYMDLYGCMDELSVDEICDAIEVLTIIKRQCKRLEGQRAKYQLEPAGDIPVIIRPANK